ncbi:hypothetical protein O9929_04695 [Vibrio lentus]|nr:hypothetical protein [Vibrio lentus]
MTGYSMKKLTLVLFGMLFLATSAHAARNKDVAKVAGVQVVTNFCRLWFQSQVCRAW